MTEWEMVCSEEQREVRRISVPGGWLYQIGDRTVHAGQSGETDEWSTGWSAPVFVSDAERMIAEVRFMIEKIAGAL